jgi:hypothetical protein
MGYMGVLMLALQLLVWRIEGKSGDGVSKEMSTHP